CIHHQGLCDLDHLLLADGAVARPTVQIDPELQPFEDLFGLTPHEAHIEQAEFRMFIADEEVLQHRQLRPDVELLMDEHDPRFFSFLEIRVIHLRPVPHNLAPVIRMDTREYFHQRRFAGAVLAHERMDRRIPEYEIHTEEHFVGPERLVYIFHFNHCPRLLKENIAVEDDVGERRCITCADHCLCTFRYLLQLFV